MKKLLLEGMHQQLSNDGDLLEYFYSDALNKFCIMFNADLRTFKSYGGFNKHLYKLIGKYNLVSNEK